MRLKPFFTYYGGKYRVAPYYPKPVYDVIVEPFAGSAGYSLRYPGRRVFLSDVDPVIVGVWDFIIRASESDVRSLPAAVEHVDGLVGVPQEARWLIGFWLNKGCAAPSKSPSAWMRGGTHASSFWGDTVKHRIASQQPFVRHWEVSECSYSDLPVRPATWFVDPPYAGKAGRHYRRNVIVYPELGRWCQSLPGQVVVCEAEGADWLPFVPFRPVKGTTKMAGVGASKNEVFWTSP